MNGDAVFVDTNIWLYALIESDDDQKRKSCKSTIQAIDNVIVSSQVVSEVCVNMLKKTNQAEDFIQELISNFYAKYEVVALDESHLLKASHLRAKYSLSYWDSLIVAAAVGAACGLLYSEDMQNGLVVEDGLKIVNPLL
jgi:predicted nucleic acid-binding protein